MRVTGYLHQKKVYWYTDGNIKPLKPGGNTVEPTHTDRESPDTDYHRHTEALRPRSVLQSSFSLSVYHATGIGAVGYSDILNVIAIPCF